MTRLEADRERGETDRPEDDRDTSPNAAPDAVKDPNAKTEGRPGAAPEGGEADPGGG